MALKVLCELGGWRTPQTVLQRCQRPDEDRLKKVFDERRPVHPSPVSGSQLPGTAP